MLNCLVTWLVKLGEQTKLLLKVLNPLVDHLESFVGLDFILRRSSVRLQRVSHVDFEG